MQSQTSRSSIQQTQGRTSADSQADSPATDHFAAYEVGEHFDEMFCEPGKPRDECDLLFNKIRSVTSEDLIRRQFAADRSMLQLGVTFNVYGDDRGQERIIPFDIVPRILKAAEWAKLERGLKQRIEAINLFLQDIYNEQKILRGK